MRWDKLFYDLESQLEGELNAEELDLGAEEERLRLGRLGLRERLEAVCGHTQEPVLVAIAGGERLRLRPVTIGRDWVSGDVVDDSTRARRCILPLASITAITLPRPVVKASLANARPEHPTLTARLGLTFVLRDLCRRRHAVQLELTDFTVHGTIDRVGRDHLDLAVHEPGNQRREAEVTELMAVSLAAVRLVRL